MSYATVFSGQIVIEDVPKEDWSSLVDLHEQLVIRYCGVRTAVEKRGGRRGGRKVRHPL